MYITGANLGWCVVGVFFAVCMALLVLSLAKSIFVVKLLHHSHEEVKQMSISACLLQRYGSTEQSFSESLFTSVRTLDDVDHSGGAKQEKLVTATSHSKSYEH